MPAGPRCKYPQSLATWLADRTAGESSILRSGWGQLAPPLQGGRRTQHNLLWITPGPRAAPTVLARVRPNFDNACGRRRVPGGRSRPLTHALRVRAAGGHACQVDARGYEELLPHVREVVDEDLRVKVIDLDTLIEIKRSTGRARDAMVVPVLIALRDRQPR